jgi:hypothetical protein
MATCFYNSCKFDILQIVLFYDKFTNYSWSGWNIVLHWAKLLRPGFNSPMMLFMSMFAFPASIMLAICNYSLIQRSQNVKDICDYRAKILQKISMHWPLNSIEFLYPLPRLHYIHNNIIAHSFRKYLL